MTDVCTGPGAWTLDLPDGPYVTPNKRLHWSKRSAWNGARRRDAHWLARSAGIGRHTSIHVRLEMHPADRRRRDPDNLVPGILKPAIDGLVDAHVVPDDTADHVDWSRPRIVTSREDAHQPGPAGTHRWLLHVSCTCTAERQGAA